MTCAMAFEDSDSLRHINQVIDKRKTYRPMAAA